MQSKVMQPKTEAFFTNLFADCLGGGRFIEARQINTHDDKRNRFFCSSIEDFLKRTENQPVKFDSYFGVNPRESKNGTSEAIKQITSLWGDVDWKNFKGGRKEAIKELREFPLRPTVVIESGHGFQPYWFLKEPEPVPEDFRLIIKGLQKKINSDAVDDLPRILRVPGTLNYKDLNKVVSCKIVFSDYRRRYVISDFEPFALQPEDVNTGPTLADTLPEKITAGSRNNTLFSVAGSMRRRGCEPNEIYAALKEINTRCVDGLDDKELRELAESSKRYTPEPNQDKGAICLSSVEAEDISFLLEPSIILGKTLTVDADPGCGKTYFMQAIAAGLSRGKGVPGLAISEPRNSLFFVTEDALGDTMKPRFEKLKADCDRIFAVTDIFRFDEPGFEKFEQHIQETQPTLVVIDPITTYLGDNVDAYRDNAVRPILSRLGKIATQYDCAIVIIRHLVKGQKTKAIYAGQNSIAFIASARSGLLLGRDPNNPEYGAAHHIKHNLTRRGDPIGYRIDSDGYFHWTGTSQLTLETILTEEVDSREDEAKLFLETRLGNGPVKAAILYTEAENDGIKKRTLQRARNNLGIKPYKGGYQGPWMWELPTKESPKDAPKNATHGVLCEVPKTAISQLQSRDGFLCTKTNSNYIDNKDLLKKTMDGVLCGTLGENGNLENPKGSQIPIKPRGDTKRKGEEPEKFEL